MEFVAWFTHKYIMHGALWSWHLDHHVKQPGFFEKSDRFFLVFAVPSMTSFIIGSLYSQPNITAIGLGILAYGTAYFFVHEILIHRRFNWFGKPKSTYLKALVKAHQQHHTHRNKEDGECFGMLIVPQKYFNMVNNK
ncbi:UNVERIFIED_CONTAM: hypothetical protein GTU68_059477 [Idotea baltica]|nr:hypothetical protein [Idotea baltica]